MAVTDRTGPDAGPPANPSASGRGGRLRSAAYWTATLVIVLELVAGSVWNAVPIEWTEVQLGHLGYPLYFSAILAAAQAGAAVVLLAPGIALAKEWAYAGVVFLWTGAAASHLSMGDEPELWGAPLMFAVLAAVSWLLRPADRRLDGVRPPFAAAAGAAGAGQGRANVRAWLATAGILAVFYAVSFATLPAVEAFMHERAVALGWIGG